MITASEDFIELMERSRFFVPVATVTLAGGSQFTPQLKDFSMGCSLTDGAGSSSFPIGEAVERCIRLEFVNDDGVLDNVGFEGAVVALSLKNSLDTEGEEVKTLGTFTVSGPETWGETVVVDAVDAMQKADAVYTTGLTFPKTLGEMLADICTTLGITLGTSTFTNYTFQIDASPADGNRTFRQVIGWIAMTAGGNARISRSGGLEIITYDFTYTSGVQVLDAFTSLKNGREDITVTGVKASAGNDSTPVLYGADGYVLSLENPLWAGKEQAAANAVGPVFVGKTMRDFEGTHVSYPLAEFMDKVAVRVKKYGTESEYRTSFNTVLTDIDFTFGGATTFKNTAESATRSGGVYSSAASYASSTAKVLVEKAASSIDVEIGAITEKAICVLSEMEPVGVADNYALVGDGLAEADSDSRICVYEVIPGQVLSVKALKDTGGVFQWQNARTTPTSGTPDTLVGDPVTVAFDGLVAAPEGASHLAVSQAKTNTTNYIGKPAKGTLA